MIEKLQQIEDKMLLGLLAKRDEWKTLLIDYYPPIVERCWIQIGNYRLYLHFIHKCEAKDALFHPHPWPSAMHVLSGKYEMGLGFGPGLEEPEKMCTILLENGGAYYDMTHIDGWHYVRPIEGVAATVMLTGKPWGREEIESPEKLGPLTVQRKLMMLEWFENYYRTKVQGQRIQENRQIKREDWVELDLEVMSADEKRGMENYFSKLGFVIGREGDMIDVRFGNDRTRVHAKNLTLLNPDTKPKPIVEPKKTTPDKNGKKLDDMDPANWPDDDDKDL
jgi:hypothetical protein